MKKAEKLACRLMGWLIRSYREIRSRVPQSAIAERLQLSLDEYRRLEAGEVRITLDLLLRVQVALNAPTEYLWFPFASTIGDASEATALQALENASEVFGDEGRSSNAMKDDPLNAFIAAQIARHRVQGRVRVIDLARGAGIPMGTVSNHLTGNCRLSLINLYRLLSYLALPITEVWPESSRPGERVTEQSILADIEAAKVQIIPPLDLADVLSAVKQVYGVYYAELASPSCERRLSEARAVAAQIVSELPHLTLVDLSVLLKRDVSSLSHCVRRMKERLEYDPVLEERLEAVRRLLLSP